MRNPKHSLKTKVIQFLATYIIVKIVHTLTGLSYNFEEGILNPKILFDLALWAIVYIIVLYFTEIYKETIKQE